MKQRGSMLNSHILMKVYAPKAPKLRVAILPLNPLIGIVRVGIWVDQFNCLIITIFQGFWLNTFSECFADADLFVYSFIS